MKKNFVMLVKLSVGLAFGLMVIGCASSSSASRSSAKLFEVIKQADYQAMYIDFDYHAIYYLIKVFTDGKYRIGVAVNPSDNLGLMATKKNIANEIASGITVDEKYLVNRGPFLFYIDGVQYKPESSFFTKYSGDQRIINGKTAIFTQDSLRAIIECSNLKIHDMYWTVATTITPDKREIEITGNGLDAIKTFIADAIE